MSISRQRCQEIIDALRRGTVPQHSLDAFAVGLERFEDALDTELQNVQAGASQFKAVRGEYGCGKTFFARWLADGRRKAFVVYTAVASVPERHLGEKGEMGRVRMYSARRSSSQSTAART